MRLNGKTAIVTGAASGIGRATAQMFAREGANVVALDLHASVSELARHEDGGRIVPLVGRADLRADVERGITLATETFGGLHVYFANAGISGRRVNLWQLEEADWEEMMRVNLISVFLGVKHASMAMAAAGTPGSIICTSSIAGSTAYGMSHYSAAKAGVVALARNAAQEFTGLGIRVNAVAPGVTESRLTQPIFDEFRKTGKAPGVFGMNPLERGGTADELAAVALFLASDDSSFVNGQTITVDGGWTCRAPTQEGAGQFVRSTMS